jgi:hypothetical protein
MRPPNKPNDSSYEPSRRTAEELALQQGVKPIADISDLKGDFWPSDDSIDEFLTWLRQTRNEDCLAS